MRHSILNVSYTLSFAAVLCLAPQVFGAPNEQTQSKAGNVTQSKAQAGSVTQSMSQSGNQLGNANQNGIISPLPSTPPKPLDPIHEVSDSLAAEAKGGIPLGDFLVYPEISAVLMYDDNIYAARENELSDKILIISPEVRIKPNFTRDSVELGVGAHLNRYQDHKAENTSDTWGYLKGRIDLTDDTNVYAGVSLLRDHEDRTSPDTNFLGLTDAFASPTRYTDFSSDIGIFHQLTEDIKVRLGASTTKLNYENTPLVSGLTYSNDYRDRTETLSGGRITYAAAQGIDLFVQAMNDHRQYDDPTFDHNSNGYNAAIGMAILATYSLSAEGYVGRIHQSYDNSAFSDVNTIDYGLNVKYKMTPTTTLSMDLDRSLEETTITDSSGYLNTALSGNITHAVSHDLSLHASLTQQWSHYNSYDRKDTYVGGGAGVKYYLTNAIYTAADYQYRQRNSTIDTADYNNNIVYITLGTDFGTRAKPTTPAY